MSIYMYPLTPWSTVLPEKLTVIQLVKKLPAGIQRFTAVFIKASRRPLFWAWSIQSTPSKPICVRSIFIQSAPESSELSLSFMFSNQYCVRIFHIPVYATYAAYFTVLVLTTLTRFAWWTVNYESSSFLLFSSFLTFNPLKPNLI
jgi:hypothetical protein